MELLINTSSMIPIYEQIVEQIKKAILQGELKEHDLLPSVRSLSKDLKISALTVKKAYDHLEEEGYTVTVHGKGSYVASINASWMMEENKKNVQTILELAIQKGRQCGIQDDELKSLFEILLEDEVC